MGLEGLYGRTGGLRGTAERNYGRTSASEAFASGQKAFRARQSAIKDLQAYLRAPPERTLRSAASRPRSSRCSLSRPEVPLNDFRNPRNEQPEVATRKSLSGSHNPKVAIRKSQSESRSPPSSPPPSSGSTASFPIGEGLLSSHAPHAARQPMGSRLRSEAPPRMTSSPPLYGGAAALAPHLRSSDGTESSGRAESSDGGGCGASSASLR